MLTGFGVMKQPNVEAGFLRCNRRQAYRAGSDWHLVLLHSRWSLRRSILQGCRQPLVYPPAQRHMLTTSQRTAQKPDCPKGIMQWQHGTYTVKKDGSLHLKPFAVDGRQLVSDPCESSNGQYTRYNQTEKYTVGRSGGLLIPLLTSPVFHSRRRPIL